MDGRGSCEIGGERRRGKEPHEGQEEYERSTALAVNSGWGLVRRIQSKSGSYAVSFAGNGHNS